MNQYSVSLVREGTVCECGISWFPNVSQHQPKVERSIESTPFDIFYLAFVPSLPVDQKGLNSMQLLIACFPLSGLRITGVTIHMGCIKIIVHSD